MRRCEAPMAPPLGELLSEREAEGVWFVNTELVPIRSCPVGADSIRPPANGAERLDEWHTLTFHSHAQIKTGHIAFFRDMPLFYYIFLAIYRILCYVIRGATSTPVDGSPFDFFLISFGGNLLLYYPQSVGKGGGRYVRYMGQFVSVLYGHSGCHSRSLSDDK